MAIASHSARERQGTLQTQQHWQHCAGVAGKPHGSVGTAGLAELGPATEGERSHFEASSQQL